MVKAVYCQSLLSPQAQAYVNKTAAPQPKYFCATCLKLKDGNYCDCFQRPVDADYNRCYNHSNYKPVVTVFKAADNIEEIALANEEKMYA